MTQAGVHSGKFGFLYDTTGAASVSTMRDWSVSLKTDVKPWVASNTRGGTGRVIGNTDWSGSFKNYAETPPFMPGDAFGFYGYTAPSTDAGGASGKVYTGAAMIDSIEYHWNWESAEPNGYDVSFSANGLFAQVADAYTHNDTTAANVPTPIGLVHKWALPSGSPSYANFRNAINATLKITAANKAYVNSTTAGQTQRVMGPIDWTYSITVQDNDITTAISALTDLSTTPLNKLYHLRLQTGTIDSPAYWQLDWGILHDISDLRVDRETGNIIQCTFNFSMAGYDLSSGDGESGPKAGQIVTPAGVTWWPFTG